MLLCMLTFIGSCGICFLGNNFSCMVDWSCKFKFIIKFSLNILVVGHHGHQKCITHVFLVLFQNGGAKRAMNGTRNGRRWTVKDLDKLEKHIM